MSELGYWPAWAGAVGLAAVTIFYTLTTERWFGMSGAWDRIVHWREERERERLDDVVDDEEGFAAALAEATAQEFGAQEVGAQQFGTTTTATVTTAQPADEAPIRRPVPLVAQAAMIVSVFVGALVTGLVSGRFQVRFDMGDGFRQLVTANPVSMIVVLFAGGLLVGFGTRLAGGCSSGHGLSGCGRLQPVSLVATAVFFGAAAAVSFLLWKVV